jgi:hypothetical protein
MRPKQDAGVLQRLGWLVALTAALCAAACSETHQPAGAAPRRLAVAILVEPSALTLRAGEQRQLAAQVNDVMGQPIGGATIVYRSANDAIATVSHFGLVTALGPPGSTYVEVLSNRLSTRVAVTVAAAAGAALELVHRPAASANAGRSLGQVQIRIRDQFGNAVGDVPVTWRVLDGGGSVEAVAAVSDADGLAAAEWRAGQRAGPQVLEVRAAELAPLVVRSRATPGNPAALHLESEPDVSAAALPLGTTLRVRAWLSDQFGNSIAGAAIIFEAPRGCRLAPTRGTGGATSAVTVDWPLSTLGSCELRVRVDGSSIETRLVVRTERAPR